MKPTTDEAPLPEDIIALFGGRVRPIVLSPEEQAELNYLMEIVDREGYQP